LCRLPAMGTFFFRAVIVLLCFKRSDAVSPSQAPTLVPILQCGACDRTMTLMFTADYYATESSWSLKPVGPSVTCTHNVSKTYPNQDENEYVNRDVEYLYQYDLPNLCAFKSYKFTFFDSVGDGCSSDEFGTGHWELYIDGTTLLGSSDCVFTTSTSLTFTVPEPPPTGLPTLAPIMKPSTLPSLPPTPTPTLPPSPRPTPQPSVPSAGPSPVPSAGPSPVPIQCGACDQTLTLDLFTDSYGQEITWALAPLKSAFGCAVNTSYAGGPFANIDAGRLHQVVVTSQICAQEGYRFTLFDTEGDGMDAFTLGDAKLGYYTLTLSGGVVGSGTGNFTTEISSSFIATIAPTPAPTQLPSAVPFPLPSSVPAPNPTARPTVTPSSRPTAGPTPKPTATPTLQPTPVPTSIPTFLPFLVPTHFPSPVPTPPQTNIPTPDPTPMPTPLPSNVPTLIPSALLSPLPSPTPTSVPTPVPTPMPTALPSYVPTPLPSATASSIGGGGGGSCFSEDSTVRMLNEVTHKVSTVRLRDLTVGQKVLAVDHRTRKGTFSAVAALPHSPSQSEFIEVTASHKTASDEHETRGLLVTEHHTFPLCDTGFRKNVAAMHLKPGHCLLTENGGKSAVTSVKRVPAKEGGDTYTVVLEGQDKLLVVGGLVTHAKPSHAAKKKKCACQH